jgi:hypothetical protein
MPHLLFGSSSSLHVIDGISQVIGLGSWFYHLVLFNSQYSLLEAALDQAGSIDFYFSCFYFFSFLIMSSFADELRRQGLLDDIISFDSTRSTVGGPPTTFFSDDSLREITASADGLQAGTKGKLFKLFLVEASRAEEE